MSNEREWAKGLSQAEFEREWPLRNIGSDVIPDVLIWSTQEDTAYPLLIDGVSPCDVLSDDADVEAKEPPKSPELQKNKGPQKGEFRCRGCDKVFEYKVARAGHERACKVALNMKKGA
jgi:hypothetical protein